MLKKEEKRLISCTDCRNAVQLPHKKGNPLIAECQITGKRMVALCRRICMNYNPQK